ncbi:UDP-N-acetyl glucosamine:UMP antiporter [Plasmodium gaboni]|uniref:UDP-N-acetyl glucosamine:UMP antiporter n=1 Tax=Plasmodium gaboni TaxID=647221 RepID=A0ABY1ULP2_9APIC|nr:UDP-N-acetyl glucosamine:UMP antiporter [Plasmodium gaboni]
MKDTNSSSVINRRRYKIKDSDLDDNQMNANDHKIHNNNDNNYKGEKINYDIKEKGEELKTIDMNNAFIKIMLFIILTFHSILYFFLIRIKKSENINYKFKNENIIFITEIVKFLISFFFFFREHKFSTILVYKSIKEIITKRRLYIVCLIIPSLLYYFQNIFFYISLANIPTPVFQLLYQFRILTVIIFSFIILKKKISYSQKISVLFLFLSLACLKDYNINDNGHTISYDKESRTNSSYHDIITNNYFLLKDFLFPRMKKNIWYKRNIHLDNFNNKIVNINNFLIPYLFDHITQKKKNIFQNIINQKSIQNENNKLYDHRMNLIYKNRDRGGNISPGYEKLEYNKKDTTIPNNNNNNMKNKKNYYNIYSNMYYNFYQHRKYKIYKYLMNYKKLSINNIRHNMKRYPNFFIGLVTTFLSTLTSGFSSVFLEFLYKKYAYSFWFQNMCLAFFTIIFSYFIKNFDFYVFFKNFKKKKKEKKKLIYDDEQNDTIIKNKNENENKNNKINNNNNNNNSSSSTHIYHNNIKHLDSNFFLFYIIKNFFFQHFNSLGEFLYLSLLIILNSIGGILIAIFIKYSGSVSRFFVTPVSMLFNIYISSIYFKDFHCTFSFFISLIFVSFSLYFYFI